MTHCLFLSVFLLGVLAQGSEAMRDPTKTLEEPSKASLADPGPSGDAPARRLDAAKTRGFEKEDELKNAVNAWLVKGTAGAEYGDIKIWDVSRITDMSSLFYNASKWNDDISKWDTARVTSMRGMFTVAMKFNVDISKWDTARVKDMNYMFTYARSFNQDLGWCVPSTVNAELFVSGTPCAPKNCGVTFMKECPTPAPSLAPTPGYCNSFKSVEICDAMPCCMWDGIVCGDDLLCNSYDSEESCMILGYCMWDGNSCTAAECGPPLEDTPLPEYDPNVPSTEAGGSGNNGKMASPDVIVIVCVAAAVLLVAALFVWNKRAVAHKQPHRETSMLTIGREDREGDVEVAESADQ